MTQKRIDNLRKKIKERIPSDYIVLKPGEHHVYYSPITGEDYVSVTTRLHVISNPMYHNRNMNRAMEYLYEHHNEITTVNKDDIFKAAKARPQELLEHAGGVGTRAHEIISDYLQEWINTNNKPGTLIQVLEGLKGRPKETDFAVWSAVRSFENWLAENPTFIPLATELKVWSPKYRIAGTLDAIGMLGEDIVILDFKTSAVLIDDYHLQVGAYWGCFRELTHYTPKRGIIIKLDKEHGIPETEEVPDLKDRFHDFVKVSDIFDAMQHIHTYRTTKPRIIL